jgi:hypothetical protein
MQPTYLHHASETVASNGTLHGTGLDMLIGRNSIVKALTYFHRVRETMAPSPTVLMALLNSYSIHCRKGICEGYCWSLKGTFAALGSMNRVYHYGGFPPPYQMPSILTTTATPKLSGL